MKTLLIDNYDSFTFNLYQLIAEVNRIPPIVIKNDALSWDEIKDLEFDNIVISPGPGRPDKKSDFGVCNEVILNANVPILGICLGHQGICFCFGGEIEYTDQVMHGRSSRINHTNEGIFRTIPSPYSAIRYHSLLVKKLPECMEKIAWTDDGIIMGAKHKTRPIWSVQFHPESIKTEYGHQLLENFRLITSNQLKKYQIQTRSSVEAAALNRKYNDMYSADHVQDERIPNQNYQIHYRRLAASTNAENVFINLYKESDIAYWLDSALKCDFSRFSYMGDTKGPYAEFLSYRVNEKKVIVKSQGKTEIFNESIFDYLDSHLKERHVQVNDLPFDFNLGYVGYFGYELKADCGFDSPHSSYTPDSLFVFSDRMIVFDHEENVIFLVCLDDDKNEARANQWLDDIEEKLKSIVVAPALQSTKYNNFANNGYRIKKNDYLNKIKEAKYMIKKGESYEVCLTNKISIDVEIDDLNTYRKLRSSNPAPYASYLKFPDITVMSSSPERFITIDSLGAVESKPIKGTRKRGKTVEEDAELRKDLITSEKDCSENLMIVDLLRNDLGRVCDIGSVHVSNLFKVETYATVHQLVSTVRGHLKKQLSAIDCIRASFPGGSMTGAPKKRTMKIIDDLEGDSRGIYSGAIGFLSLNGSTDMSIAIRTIVKTDKDITIGVGGAIIDLSDPLNELEEIEIKSDALVKVLFETKLTSN